jgi:hypothetical protein
MFRTWVLAQLDGWQRKAAQQIDFPAVVQRGVHPQPGKFAEHGEFIGGHGGAVLRHGWLSWRL